MKSKRSMVMIGALAALGALVLMDRMGGASADGSTDSASARAVYAKRAANLASAEALVAQEGAWRAEAQSARQAWERTRERLIVAPSANVAQTRLSEMVGRELKDVGARLRVSDVLAARTPIEGEALRVVGMSLDFEADNPDALYALLDRLENMRGARTNIERLMIAGPARTGGAGLSVKMDLVALAWIES